MKRWTWLGLIVIFMAAISSRLWHLDNLPRGLHNDEASIGYNAYLVSTTGADEHEVRYPLYFKAFGEYKNPLLIYTSALIFKFLPVSETALRLSSVLWFGLFLLILYKFVRQVFAASPWVWIYTLLAASFLPWFFPSSRIALEVITQLATLTLALWLIYLTYVKNERSLALLTGLSIALFTYSYSTSRLLSVLLTLSLVAIYSVKKYWSTHVKVVIGIILGLLPYLAFSYVNPQALTSRFKDVSYLYDGKLTQLEKGQTFVKNYFHYLSPSYLLTTGDSSLRHHIGSGGEIYLIVAVLAIVAGAGNWWRLRRNRFLSLVLINLLLSPIPAALTRGDSALRSLTVGLYILLLSAYGFNLIARLQPFRLRLLIAGALALLVVESGWYLYRYFDIYPPLSATAMGSYDFKNTLAIARNYQPTDIIISDKGLTPYIQLKFYELVLPPSNIPTFVGLPQAQVNRCIIYSQFGDIIFNSSHLSEQLAIKNNYTKLSCF